MNTARNFAIEPIQTHFLFSLDIELYPSPFFIQRFLKMINTNISLLNSNIVYVPPYFEITSTAKVPDTKTALLRMLANKTAIYFHAKLCKYCHLLPYMHEWNNIKESNDLKIFKTFKRHGRYKGLEPMFVSTVRDPIYDDRFFWEGAGDKLPQVKLLFKGIYTFF